MADHACTIAIVENRMSYDGRHLIEIQWDWLSATSQAVTAAVGKTTVSNQVPLLTGYVAHFYTWPGTTTPTSYNITLKNADGVTCASKTGASTTAVESHTAGFYIVNDSLEIAVNTAGAAKTGHAKAILIV